MFELTEEVPFFSAQLHSLPKEPDRLDFLVVKTYDASAIRHADQGYSGIINIARLNNFRHIDRFFRKVHSYLQCEQYFVFRLETQQMRARRKFGKYPAVIRYPCLFADFIIHRVMPRLSITQKLYFRITNGKNRVISFPEALARSICSGFDIVDCFTAGQDTFVIIQKNDKPPAIAQPTCGLFIKLKRVGFKGRPVVVYKIRTMHPYSEFLQEYLFEMYGTGDGDKIENDFRVACWGRFMRKYWLDEIPMLWNWIKRDLKLIGVRPLSEHKFSTYPVDLQKRRIRFKPGLIPPYYADLPETVEEFFESERRYLDQYEKHPIRTDLKYMFKAFYNIVFRGQRSR